MDPSLNFWMHITLTSLNMKKPWTIFLVINMRSCVGKGTCFCIYICICWVRTFYLSLQNKSEKRTLYCLKKRETKTIAKHFWLGYILTWAWSSSCSLFAGPLERHLFWADVSTFVIVDIGLSSIIICFLFCLY